MSSCCGGPSGVLGSKAAAPLPRDAEGVRQEVRTWYGSIAQSVAAGGGASCCGGGPARESVITRNLYSEEEAAALPGDAVSASLGCGNPTYLAELHEGEVVLDLGSGGGIDVLLSARRVGPTGMAYGLDMTGEMLALARENQARAGIENARFLEGSIEAIPLPDEAVDVIISNCVVNLSPEKERVFAEAYRVLRPGGRLAIADVVFREEPARDVREEMGLWSACIGGALTAEQYEAFLREAGFVDVALEFTRDYGAELAEGYAEPREAMGTDLHVGAAFVRAAKPTEAAAG